MINNCNNKLFIYCRDKHNVRCCFVFFVKQKIYVNWFKRDLKSRKLILKNRNIMFLIFLGGTFHRHKVHTGQDRPVVNSAPKRPCAVQRVETTKQIKHLCDSIQFIYHKFIYFVLVHISSTVIRPKELSQ